MLHCLDAVVHTSQHQMKSVNIEWYSFLVIVGAEQKSMKWNRFRAVMFELKAILTSLSLSLELSASLGATDDVVSRSDALPLSSDVPGSFAIVSEFWKKKKKKTLK